MPGVPGYPTPCAETWLPSVTSNPVGAPSIWSDRPVERGWGRPVALFEHLVIRNSPRGDLVLPVLWSDNDVTLWPGESITLTAHLAAAAAETPVIEVSAMFTMLIVLCSWL